MQSIKTFTVDTKIPKLVVHVLGSTIHIGTCIFFKNILQMWIVFHGDSQHYIMYLLYALIC